MPPRLLIHLVQSSTIFCHSNPDGLKRNGANSQVITKNPERAREEPKVIPIPMILVKREDGLRYPFANSIVRRGASAVSIRRLP